jgi:Fe-S-cluster containining protein
VYDRRPDVCRSYAADELCLAIAADTVEERVTKYLEHFQLTQEAKNVQKSGCTSLRAFRALTTSG